MKTILFLIGTSFMLLSCSSPSNGYSENEAAFRLAPDFELITVFGSRNLGKNYEQIEVVGDYAYLLLNDKSEEQEVNFMILNIS
ncbi:MAG: hypothetical protein GWN00_03815, partial [Aliifodinibius sp.]|nr:hypothetical protein [Fodinibius sp.]NIY23963.1 hypothetical protein [Fodinibius sp.]